jgi:predicted nucleotidyltransferase
MTSAEFKKRLLSEKLSDLVWELYFEDLPHLFSANRGQYRAWRLAIAEKLDISPNEIILVGSAATGFSLNPRKDFAPFRLQSDVDVAVVSEYYFSEAWRCLRRIDLTLSTASVGQKNALREHKEKFVYFGCIATDKILPLLPFNRRWMVTRSSLAQMAPTSGREINFRIYKDFRALTDYHANGLESLRTELQ